MEALEQLQDQIDKLLLLSQPGSRAVDPVSRAFSLGRASAFEDTLKLIKHALKKEATARIKAAAHGRIS
jgi:hypothetical protein